MEKRLTKIRMATSDDLPAINSIAKQVHDLHVRLRPDIYLYQEEVITTEYFTQLLKEALIFIGEIDEEIVSYAVCFIRTWLNPVQVKRKVMFVDALGIENEYRRWGIGTQMMDHIMAYAKKAGCDRLELQVMEVNQEAKAFYNSLNMKIKAQIMELDLEKTDE